MPTTTEAQLITCTSTDCTAEFFFVVARGETATMCLDHGHEHMRANGHQNDPTYSVD
jgi:hypothetical protein